MVAPTENCDCKPTDKRAVLKKSMVENFETESDLPPFSILFP
jgi:hypothetical protein